jgi:His/Glu/Gln/Arg/opine family amino acid ABC transporter permease subunit
MDNLLAFSGQIFQGLLTTLALAVGSIPPAFGVGIAVAMLQLAPSPALSAAGRIYTAIFRGVPELLVLFFFYYGLSGIVSLVVGHYVEFSNFQVAIVALACISGAYSGEVFRGAIQAVPRGQWESAAALGLRPLHTWALIILPQAARIALPALGNLLLILLKDTALASAVGAEELMRKSSIAAGSTNAPFTFFGTAAAIYLAITIPILLLQSRVEEAGSAR